jgi:hypothetical protein
LLAVGQESGNVVPSHLSNSVYFVMFEQNFSHDTLKIKQQYKYSLQSTPKSRPTGVTIIAILNIIGGAFSLIGGIGLITLGALLPLVPPSAFNQSELQGNLTAGQPPIPIPPTDASMFAQSLFGGISLAIGAVLVAIAIVSFVVAYGLLKGRGWAWTVTIILSIISIVWNAITVAGGNFFGIVSIIVSGIIIYYLYRPHVKAFFGKGVSTSPPAA